MKVTDVILVSILWAIVAAPVITLYPATTALVATIKQWDDAGATGLIWKTFFGHFKSELKLKLVFSVFWFIVFASVYANYLLYSPIETQMDRVIVSASFISNAISVCIFFVSSILWGLSNVKVTLKQLLIDSLLVIASRPFRSLLVTAILLFLIESILTLPIIYFISGIVISLLSIILTVSK